MKHPIFAAALVWFVGLGFATQVAALTVSPVRVEISGDPGQTLEGEFALLNEQQETKTFYSSSQNFEARGESGSPSFLPDTGKGLASWVEVQESVILKPGERKIIPYSIKIPAGTEPSGYFAAIFWGTSPPKAEGGGDVTVGGKLGVLILLSVSGQTEEGGGILEFNTENGKLLSVFPVNFIYRFSNDGSKRAHPDGKVKVKNVFGQTVATLNANPSSGNVLPKSIRKFEVPWKTKTQDDFDEFAKVKKQFVKEDEGVAVDSFFGVARSQLKNFAFGIYKAELDFNYGEDQKNAKADFRFLIIPWQLLSIVIILLVVMGFGGWLGIKSYNRWLIAKITQIKGK